MPSAAPFWPPETGASRKAIPAAASRAAIAWAASAAIVEQSTTTVPARAPRTVPCPPRWTSSTSGASGRHETTTSLARPTSSGVSQNCAPSSSASARALAAVREASASGNPAFARFRAMGIPIVPSPTKPTRAAIAAILGSEREGRMAREVVVTEVGGGLAQEIRAGRHVLRSDEPVASGGTDTGPDPYALLLAALGSCTSMTLRLYARKKGWPLERISVALSHERIHETGLRELREADDSRISRITREITLDGALSARAARAPSRDRRPLSGAPDARGRDPDRHDAGGDMRPRVDRRGRADPRRSGRRAGPRSRRRGGPGVRRDASPGASRRTPCAPSRPRTARPGATFPAVRGGLTLTR